MAGQAIEPGVQRSPQAVVLRAHALPTDTSVRFVLLLAAVITASLYLFQALWFVARGELFLATVERCGGIADVGAGPLAATTRELQRQSACRAGLSNEQALFALAGVGVVMVVAWIAYRMRPSLRERRSKLEPLDPLDGQDVLAAVAELSAQARLATPPTTRIDAVNPGVQAFAYGAGSHQRLGMTGGLVAQQYVDPSAFRAVVRHELAHLTNRDVPWTYYTVSAWWAFLFVAVVPVVVIFIVSDPEYVVRLGWRTAALALLVAVVGTGVLRTREVYADARAAEWGSAPELDRILAAEKPTRQRRPWWLRLHPSGAQRRQLLADPDGLFVADWVTAFATGVTGGLAFTSLHSLAYLAVPRSGVLPLCALLIAPLIAGVLCVTAWRVGMWEAIRAQRRPLGLPMGVGLGVGLAVAPLLAIDSAVSGVAQDAAGWAGYLLWCLGMVVAAALVTRWVVDAGRVRVASTFAAATPTRALVVHIAASSLAIALLLVLGSQSLLILTVSGPDALTWPDFWPWLPLSIGAGLQSLPTLAIGLLVLTPLLARRDMARRRTGAPISAVPEHWAWRHPPGMVVSSIDEPPAISRQPSLRAVAAVGLGAGLAAAVMVVATRVISTTVEASVRGSDAFAVALGEGVWDSSIAAAVIASVAAAFVLPGRWWTLSLVAGGLAAVITSVTGLGASVAAGCGLLPTTDPGCSLPGWTLTRVIVIDSLAQAAVPVCLLAAVVGVWHSWRLRRGIATSGSARAIRIAAVVAAGAAAASAGSIALDVRSTEPTVVTGPGFTVELPAGWTSPPGPTMAATQFDTIAQDLQVVIAPAQSAEPTIATGPSVGGVPAGLVRTLEEGSVRLEQYQVQAPAGVYVVVVVGTPVRLEQRDAALDTLFQAVTWSTQ
jgi:Zn-dependent protease with chaperone function